MAKCCPKCGSTLAFVLTQWAVTEAELYDLATGKYMAETIVEDSKMPAKTYRVAGCEKCGTRFRLSDEQYEQYKW